MEIPLPNKTNNIALSTPILINNFLNSLIDLLMIFFAEGLIIGGLFIYQVVN